MPGELSLDEFENNAFGSKIGIANNAAWLVLLAGIHHLAKLGLQDLAAHCHALQ